MEFFATTKTGKGLLHALHISLLIQFFSVLQDQELIHVIYLTFVSHFWHAIAHD